MLTLRLQMNIENRVNKLLWYLPEGKKMPVNSDMRLIGAGVIVILSSLGLNNESTLIASVSPVGAIGGIIAGTIELIKRIR